MFHSLSTTKVINPQPGWYRGDFHVHSHFSDGVIPIDALVDIAKSEGMDFFVLTGVYYSRIVVNLKDIAQE